MKQDKEPEIKFEPWVIGLIAAIMIILAIYFDHRQEQNERDIAGLYKALDVETDIKQ